MPTSSRAARRIGTATVAAAAVLALATAPAHADTTPTGDPAALVDTLIGTSGGGTYPGPVVPFGAVQWGPDTSSRPPGGGYAATDTSTTGFSLTHASGSGCAAYGDVPFLPTVGAIGTSPATATSPLSHTGEVAQAGYYAVDVGSPPVSVAMSATPRTAIGAFTYPATAQANMLLKLTGGAAGATAGTGTVVDDNTVTGSATGGRSCGATTPTVYFAATFDRPFSATGSWVGKTVTAGATSVAGAGSGLYLTFDTSAWQVVRAKVAVSYVSAAAALADIAAEDPGWSLDTVRAQAHQDWNDLLTRITVGGGTPADRTTFYTALYHSLLAPSIASDSDGRYLGTDGTVHSAPAGRTEYANFAGTGYQSQLPLLALLAPDRTSDMVRSIVDSYTAGGRLPEASYAGRETGTAVGRPADTAIAAAYAFGARDYDTGAALAAVLGDAGRWDSASAQGYLDRLGYLPQDAHYDADPRGTVSTTLAYAGADFAVSRLAGGLGDGTHADTYAGRAQREWQSVLNPATGLVQPRNADGGWAPGFDPTGNAYGFTGGDSYQYTPDVPFNVAGLAQSAGGAHRYETYLMTLTDAINGATNSPYANLANPVDLQVPWEFDYVGAPWQTQQVVRLAQTSLYGDRPAGLPGADGLGAKSSWYVWSALGLYPETPGTADLALGSPLFPTATIELPNGRTLTINAPAASDTTPYVTALSIDGTEWTRPSLPAAELTTGGTLDYTLQGTADTSWGATAAPPSYPAGSQSATGWLAPNGTTTVAPGAKTTLTLNVRNLLGSAQQLSWSATATGGLTLKPGSGKVSVAALGTGTAAITVQAGAAASASVTVRLTDAAGTALTPAVAPVHVIAAADLSASFTNVGVSDDGAPLAGNLDGAGGSYSAQALAGQGLSPGAALTDAEVSYAWPAAAAGTPDNVLANGQTVPVPADPGATRLGLLASAAGGTNSGLSGNVWLNYTTGVPVKEPLTVSDWTLGGGTLKPAAGNDVVATVPGHNTAQNTTVAGTSYVFAVNLPVDPTRTLASLTLPVATAQGAVHLFGVGLASVPYTVQASTTELPLLAGTPGTVGFSVANQTAKAVTAAPTVTVSDGYSVTLSPASTTIPAFGTASFTATVNRTAASPAPGELHFTVAGEGATVALSPTDSLVRLATMTASSTHANFSPDAANDGVTSSAGWSTGPLGGGWNDGTSGIFPDWLAATWKQPVTLATVTVYSLDSTAHPAAKNTLSAYDIQAQQPDGSWLTVASIRGNTAGEVTTTFPAVTTTALRLYITDTADHTYSRVIELAASAP